MRFSTSLWTSARWMCTQSFTPANRTDWLPTGRPALVSLFTARATSGVVSAGGGEGKAVAAGDEHVAHLRRAAQVVELRLVLLAVEVLTRVAHDARARAVAAIAGALRGHQHQHAVRVAVDEAGHRGVTVLGERVLHHPREGLRLAPEGDDLAAERVVGVLRVDQAQEVRRDVHAELVRRREALALLVGQLQDPLDFLEVVDPVRELPAPVVPLLIGDVRPTRSTAAARGLPVRTERLGRVAQIHEWRFRRHLDRRTGPDLLLAHAGTSATACIKSMQTGWRDIIPHGPPATAV